MDIWKTTRRIRFACALMVVAGVGCGGPTGPKRLPVTGTVTRESQPIDDGSIVFIPKGDGPSVGGIIKEGQYKFTVTDGVPPGSYRVEIMQRPLTDPDFVGRKSDAPVLKDDRFQGKMPPKGWVKEAEVDADQKDPIDFEISEEDGAADSGGAGAGKSKPR